MQDSKDDWLRESARMASVYENATCTIAAHSAPDGQSGFLGARQRSSRGPIGFSSSKSSDFGTLVNQSMLSRRGWVFQERILSERIIHFTKDCIFLEDSSGVRTQAGRKVASPPGYSPWDNGLSVREAGHGAGSWYRLMDRYSNCELTYKTDRLPAVAGLAEAFARHGDVGLYMCGLWSESIHHGLLWAENSEVAERVGDPYRPGHSSPTWSWASWSGLIRYDTQLEGCQPLVAAVLDRNAHRYAHRPLLSLRGRLCIWDKVDLVHSPLGTLTDRWSAQYQGTKSYPFRCHLDGRRSGKHHYERLGLVLVAVKEKKDHFFSEDTDRVVWITSRRFHFILVVQDEQHRGRFRRVGIGETVSDRWWTSCAETVIHLV